MAAEAAGDAGASASLPYHEPGIVTILVQASFLLLLNIVNAALDRVVFCGLLGQVLVGVAWGTPGAKWLSLHVEEVVVQLGYLGLVLIVYQGGLSTSFASLKAILHLSSAVAVTGIGVPIALSFALQGLLGATPLQAFAAGAALCSTSLGTTFTVLASSGLSNSRLGVVLTSAAMMDDVVGLVIVQIISNLGGSISAVTVVRPLLVSLAFAVVAPLVCRFVVKPTTLSFNSYRDAHRASRFAVMLDLPQTALAIHTLLLIALVAGATYAGTSNLLAAYIAGATISWWDSEVPHLVTQDASAQSAIAAGAGATWTAQSADTASTLPREKPLGDDPAAGVPDSHPDAQSRAPSTLEKDTSGVAIFERYYAQVVIRILQPFFFASIGFSIPITRMFRGRIVWRGIIYAILMTVGKLVCGLWLVRFPPTPAKTGLLKGLMRMRLPFVPQLWGKGRRAETDLVSGRVQQGSEQRPAGHPSVNVPKSTSSQDSPSAPKPISLYPPLMLALAMTARGEIGFLISAVAESKGVFSPSAEGKASGESDIFLVVTWAIVLCTIAGPLGVGLCVRRVKLLERRKNKQQEGAGKDVLGAWGVD